MTISIRQHRWSLDCSRVESLSCGRYSLQQPVQNTFARLIQFQMNFTEHFFICLLIAPYCIVTVLSVYSCENTRKVREKEITFGEKVTINEICSVGKSYIFTSCIRHAISVKCFSYVISICIAVNHRIIADRDNRARAHRAVFTARPFNSGAQGGWHKGRIAKFTRIHVVPSGVH